MEAVLTNADVRVIWSTPLEVSVVSVDQAEGEYCLATLSDGEVQAAALLQGTVPEGRRLSLTKHRVQWINERRYWFVTEWADVGPAGAIGTRTLSNKAPILTPAAADTSHPFDLRATPGARPIKRARTAASRRAPPPDQGHPFVL